MSAAVGSTLTKRAIGPLDLVAGVAPVGVRGDAPPDARLGSGDALLASAVPVPPPADRPGAVRWAETVAPPATDPPPRPPEPTLPRPPRELDDEPGLAPLEGDSAVVGVAVADAAEAGVESRLGVVPACVVLGKVGTGSVVTGALGSDGVLTEGVVTLGVLSCGVVSGPMVTDGTVADGTVSDGAVTVGAESVGAVSVGTVTVGIETVGNPIDAALASAAPASNAAESSIRPPTARTIRLRLLTRHPSLRWSPVRLPAQQ